MRTETFHTPGPLSLDVRNVSGRVEVRTVEGEETRVVVEADPEVEREVIVELRERDGGHELVVASDKKERRFLVVTLSPTVDIRITCPHGARAALRTVSADVEVEGRVAGTQLQTVSGDARLERIEGDGRMRTVSGDVEADEVLGDLSVQTVSGDARVRSVAGRAELRSVSGDLRVDEAARSVEAQSVSGDVMLRSTGEGRVHVKTVSGDVVIGVRHGSKVWMDVSSKSGDTSSELAVGDVPPNGDGPSLELRATALSGDIRIARAPA